MESKLAIHGGPPVRSKPLPYRALFGKEELGAIERVFLDSWNNKQDFGYQGKYEEEYTSNFCSFQGGGYADAVCSGSVAVYIAVKALGLEAGSKVILSPVTDPGCVSAVILAGHQPVLADSCPNQFNIGPDQFEAAISPNTRAAVLTHTGGIPIEMDRIMQIARKHNIKVVEDCSQAHGALYKGKRVGCFGDVAAFSTMFSKNHATGGSGGVVYTSNQDLYWLMRALSDRGKPFNNPSYNPKDPAGFLFPALNFNSDELSCAIGIATLSRLEDIIAKRLVIANAIDAGLRESSVVFPVQRNSHCKPSVFFHSVNVAVERLTVSKKEFAEAVAAEGIWINPDYRYVVSEWGWANKYLINNNGTPNAKSYRDRSFNILINERFGDNDIQDIINAILKVEKSYVR